MRIVIIAMGSRGDTQPYVALGVGLQQAGYDVRIVAGDNFAEFVTARGLDFVPLGVDLEDYVNNRIPGALETGWNTFRALREVLYEGIPYMDTIFASVSAACQDADALVGGLVGGITGFHFAEYHGIPMFWGLTMPLPGRTRVRPSPIFPFRVPRALNPLTYTVMEGFLFRMLRPLTTKWRAQLGLPPLPRTTGYGYGILHGRPVVELHAVSPAVLPHPADWGPHRHTTGYWFLDHYPGWTPPAELVDFLDDGPPPVYVGFGSMSSRDPERITGIVLDALRLAGQRGVIATGWGGINAADLPDDVFLLQSCPHDWLFPRMAAVVHHGGAGTTGAGLRAGVPAVTVPFFGDQAFWGRRVRALGAGPQPVPRRALRVDRLADAIRVAVTHTPIRDRAAALGAHIRTEDGVGRAVAVIGRVLEGHDLVESETI